MAGLNDQQLSQLQAALKQLDEPRRLLPPFTRGNPLEHIPRIRELDDESLRHLALLQGVVIEKHFSSHRRWLGPVIVGIKKRWNRLLNRLVLSVVGRQLEFNQEMWHLAMIVRLQEERIQRLEQTLAARSECT